MARVDDSKLIITGGITTMMRVITLLINGQPKDFTRKELSAIVEKQLAQEEKEGMICPIEGKWFEVNPKEIATDLFKEKREDSKQEVVRQLILQAFSEMHRYPKRYNNPFEVMRLDKNWENKNLSELLLLAKCIGNHNADWVEQCFEWAKRIQNGESWETICNEADTAKWRRIVIWKDGRARIVGGAIMINSSDSATTISPGFLYEFNMVNEATPSIVRYK